MTTLSHLSMTLSVQAQMIMLVLGVYALVARGGGEHSRLLNDVLTLEVAVQLVELAFYVFVLRFMSNTTQLRILRLRYADWFVTTPLMLIGTLALFHYRRFDGGMLSFVEANRWSVLRMLLANMVMLVAGLLYTFGRLGFWPSQIVGFAALALAFRELWLGVASTADAVLFWCVFVTWTLYGVAVHYPLTQRNIWYNFLDVVSKNAVGIYAAVLVLQ